MTILSHKTIFEPTFSAISENLFEYFFAKSQKLRFQAKMAIFFARLPKFGQNENFYQKKVSAIFLPLLSPNFICQASQNPRSGFRDQFVTHARTNELTDKGDIIEPVAFAGLISEISARDFIKCIPIV